MLYRALILSTMALLLQFYAPAQQDRQFSFRHYTVLNGLVSNSIESIVQDADGYMWIASNNGLQRYDGTTFLTFRPKEGDRSSLPSLRIVTLFLDRHKNLWLAGDNHRVGIFNTRTFHFEEIELPEKRNFYNPAQFQELPNGNLLIRIDQWLYTYDSRNRKASVAHHLIPMPRKWILNSLAWDERQKCYWVTADSGLLRWDPLAQQAAYRGHNPANDPVIKAYQHATYTANPKVDRSGNLIFQFWPPTTGAPKVCRFNRSTLQAEQLNLGPKVGYHEINGFFEQKNGRMWIHGYPFFVQWTGEKDPFSINLRNDNGDQSFSFDYAYQVFEDRESNIWVATDNGVYQFNPDAQVFTTYNVLRPGGAPMELAVQAAAEVDDKIIIGCWGGGIFSYDRNLHPAELPRGFGEAAKHMSVWDMEMNSKTRQLWICEQGGRLSVFDTRTRQLTQWIPDIFKKSTIRQVDEDTAGNLWFGTHNGMLIKWDLKKSGGDIKKGFEFILKTGMIHKVHYDWQGYIWVATSNNGLLKVDARTGQIVHTFTNNGKPGERIFMNSPADMTYYNDTTLVVAAGCLNIINTRTNKVRFIGMEEGLPSNTAESVERDSRGIVWVGMTNGISRINLAKNLVSFYDRRNGITYDKFNKTGVKELGDGRILFFTDHNFLSFRPESFNVQNLPPKPVITSFQVGGKLLPVDSLMKAGRAMLNYNNTSINIYFSALSYLQQKKLHYYYKLEGVDPDWIHTDQPKEAIYNYIKPGHYTFKVKSENADGMISTEMTALEIVVEPPFWNTWWFYGLMILLVITVLYLIDRERLNKRRSLRQMRGEIAGNLHSEISRTLNNINVLSEIAKIKADKNVEQSKDFIDQISHKSRYMIEVMEDMLWSIDPQNDSMKKTLLRIRELTDGIKAANNVDIDLIVDHKVQSLELDMKLRHEIYFFYKEAITSIVEQLCCKQVFVNINQVKTRILIEILTECTGVTEEMKTRFRKQVGRRAEALGGTLDIVSDQKSFSVVMYIQL